MKACRQQERKEQHLQNAAVTGDAAGQHPLVGHHELRIVAALQAWHRGASGETDGLPAHSTRSCPPHRCGRWQSVSRGSWHTASVRHDMLHRHSKKHVTPLQHWGHRAKTCWILRCSCPYESMSVSHGCRAKAHLRSDVAAAAVSKRQRVRVEAVLVELRFFGRSRVLREGAHTELPAAPLQIAASTSSVCLNASGMSCTSSSTCATALIVDDEELSLMTRR